MKNIFLLFLFSSVFFNAAAQLPQRKAYSGVLLKEAPAGAMIDSVLANSSFGRAGLVKGDVLVSINNTPVKDVRAINILFSNLRADDKMDVVYARNGTEKRLGIIALPKPLETSALADLKYDWVKFKNGYLRVITRRPKGKENVPAILLIPGYGCGSIENYAASYNGKLMNEWLRNGYAVVTIEKSGIGDSYGCAPCTEADLVTDIESFDAGYAYMEQLSFVDKQKLYIWGHSMGGTIAPEVAKKHTPRGVIVFGAVFRQWSEFLLEMHRVQKPLLEGFSYQQTEDFVRNIQQVYYEFFVLKRSPEQLHQNTAFKLLVERELNYKPGSTLMWGRHWKFWQQLDSLNLAKSWQEVNCPVLVLHGATDYEQCSLVEPMLTEKAVNEKHPGNATMLVIPGLDHFMMNSATWAEAAKHFKEQQYAKGNFNEQIAKETVKWLLTH